MTQLERFEQNKRLAYLVAYRVWSNPVHRGAIGQLEDAHQVALIALWKACGLFDPGRGIQFSTYAYITAKNELLRLTGNHLVRVPNPVMSDLFDVMQGRQPRRRTQRENLLNGTRAMFVQSLEAVTEDLAGKFISDGRDGPGAALEHADEVRQAQRLLRRLLARLRPQERRVVRWLNGIGCSPLAMKAVADRLGVTRSRVAQIRIAAMGKLLTAARKMRQAEAV